MEDYFLNEVRVRFAPSPTGYLHVGGLRTALYNYLFAKKNGGKFILRIEDTDRTRYVEGAAVQLMETLKWTGLEYDEGPDKAGNFGPYIQSERLDIYKKYAFELVEKGKAYYAFDTAERLQDLRDYQYANKLQPKYDKLALNLTKEEVNEKLKAGEPFVIRLNVPENERIIAKDLVRGLVEFNTDIIDDQVLMKSDGFPTYHLANVVDDHLMGISHVIRGEEWLSSLPKHILLYQYLGWEIPEFAHLPLLLNQDKSKLSKRQGDVAVEDYKNKGYLKESLVNFVALLGWSTSDNREMFSLEELVEEFSIDRVHKSGAVFNIEKLNWLNAEHLRKKSNEELTNMLRSEYDKSRFAKIQVSDEFLSQVVEAMRERVSFVHEYIEKSSYLFERPTEYDQVVVQKRWKEDSSAFLKDYADKISEIENPTREDYDHILHQLAEEWEVGIGKVIHPLRLALSGVGIGPGMFDLAFILGKNEVIVRINSAIEKIKI